MDSYLLDEAMSEVDNELMFRKIMMRGENSRRTYPMTKTHTMQIPRIETRASDLALTNTCVSGTSLMSGFTYPLVFSGVFRTGDPRSDAYAPLNTEKPKPDRTIFKVRAQESYFNSLDLLRISYEEKIPVEIIERNRERLDLELKFWVPLRWKRKLKKTLNLHVEVLELPLQELQQLQRRLWSPFQ